ncbi:alkaline serine protease [Lecanosticta acicola]|uniref:Alkaline serine protease n=1 Tax=Lecanosticta acicola TaxID=111012 RepID=A0AAI8Z2A5_9PEZI|nr:alkaline serine protease [Lecanosticta acicola]
MHFSSLAAFAALAAVAVAAPTNNVQRHVLHERRDTSSAQWTKRDRVHSDVKLPVRIGMTQTNLDKGHDLLMDVSDPASKNYGKHWSMEEIHDMFAPSKDSVDAVRSWLEKAGVEAHRISQSANKQWMQMDLSTAEAEALLQTKYHFFEHAPSGKATIGCDEYHVHEDVKDHVDYITPGIKLYATRTTRPPPMEIEKRTFGIGSGVRPQPPLLESLPLPIEQIVDTAENLLGDLALGLCDVAITPNCIRAMYNFTQATTAQPGNELGIFEDLGDYYSGQDLDEFFALLAPRIPQGTRPTFEGIDGAPNGANVTNAGPESDLDFQISYPIIYPQKSVLFQTDDPVYEANYTYAGFLNNFLDALDGSYCNASAETLDPPYPHDVPGGFMQPKQCGVYSPTNVISVSYGGQEFDLPASYQMRQCAEFMKLGMNGVSIFISSGDSGVGGPAGDDNANGCLNATDGSNVGNVFSPDFPATCPYITAVGATLLTGSAKQDQETAVTRFASGGGFSNIYAQPAYQQSAVNTYLTAHKPPYQSYTGPNTGQGVYNASGRGYPDVSAVGDNVVIINQGAPTLIGGTSASSPVFASILTRINDERLKSGKNPVGFVNPTLYQNPQVLHDITTGDNPGCNSNGFSVATGWDPVTGLGTPNYPAMLELFMGLP